MTPTSHAKAQLNTDGSMFRPNGSVDSPFIQHRFILKSLKPSSQADVRDKHLMKNGCYLREEDALRVVTKIRRLTKKNRLVGSLNCTEMDDGWAIFLAFNKSREEVYKHITPWTIEGWKLKGLCFRGERQIDTAPRAQRHRNAVAANVGGQRFGDEVIANQVAYKVRKTVKTKKLEAVVEVVGPDVGDGYAVVVFFKDPEEVVENAYPLYQRRRAGIHSILTGMNI